MTGKKTTLPSRRNQDGKKVKVETKKVNSLLQNIPTYNIAELNELIYAEAKLTCGKTCFPLRYPNRNTKPGREIRLEGQGKEIVATS